jgi:hypothetical protein
MIRSKSLILLEQLADRKGDQRQLVDRRAVLLLRRAQDGEMHEIDRRVGFQQVAPGALAGMRLARDQQHAQPVAHAVDDDHRAVVVQRQLVLTAASVAARAVADRLAGRDVLDDQRHVLLWLALLLDQRGIGDRGQQDRRARRAARACPAPDARRRSPGSAAPSAAATAMSAQGSSGAKAMP